MLRHRDQQGQADSRRHLESRGAVPDLKITLPSGYSTSDPSRYDAFPFLYRGALPQDLAGSMDNYIGPGGYTCYEQSDKKAECEGSLYIDPHPSHDEVDSNSDATTWKTGVSLLLFKANGNVAAHEARPGP